MNNLEKIQKGMNLLQILSKIILVFTVVGGIITFIGTTFVALNVIDIDSLLLHFLPATVEITKEQLVWILIATTVSLLFSGIFAAFVYRYFSAELKDGTPFTTTGADKIKQLGIMQIILSILSMSIIDGIYEKIHLTEWNRFDDANSIILGICLILIAMVVRYGSELEYDKSI